MFFLVAKIATFKWICVRAYLNLRNCLMLTPMKLTVHYDCILYSFMAICSSFYISCLPVSNYGLELPGAHYCMGGVRRINREWGI